MATSIQTVLSNPSYYAVKIEGDVGITFGLTGTDTFEAYGCTPGGAELIGAYWSIPDGKTITLEWVGATNANCLHLNGGGSLSNEHVAGGISDNSILPTGQMKVTIPAALAANTYYTLLLEFGRGANGQATTSVDG